MARTKSQKRRRLTIANTIRQAQAAQTRHDIEVEALENRSYQSNHTLDVIRKSKQSAIALRHTLHHKKVTYVTNKDGTLGARHKHEDLPLVRIATTSRLERHKRNAARLLQLHHRYAKRVSMSKRDMLRRFVHAYPSEAWLLGLLKDKPASAAKLDKFKRVAFR